MADLAKLKTALRNAHAAGDEGAARRFAEMIRESQSELTSLAPASGAAQRLSQYGVETDERRATWRPEGLEDAPWNKRLAYKVGTSIDDILASVASGATFGYADEIVGALGGDKEFAEQRLTDVPIAPRIAGEIAGGIGTTLLAAPLAGATKMGQMFSRLPGWMKTTGLGALWGGLYGSGTSEEGRRLVGAGMGAGVGAVTGGALHAGAAGVMGATRKTLGYLRSRRDPQRQAHRVLAEKLIEDKITPSRVRARLRELGPQATIADAGGEGTLGLTRGLAGEIGPPRQRIMQTLGQRAQGEAERVTKVVTKYLGPGDFFAAEERFLAKLSEGAREVYANAYKANPVVTSRNLELMIRTPIMQRGINEAKFIAEVERAAGQAKWLGPVDKELTELANFAASVGKMERPGRPGVAKAFSLETWDYLKRGLDSVLDKPAYRNELTGKLNKKGYAIDSLKRSLVRLLDKATGGEKSLYKAARKQYGGDAEVLQSLREGAKFFKQSPEEIQSALAKMSEGARAAYRNGASRAILDIVENTPDTLSVANRLFAKSMTRKKIEAIFPNRGEFREFSRKMIAEQRFTQTKRAVGEGSRTAPMMAEMEAVNRTLGNIGAVVGSELPGGGHALVKSGIVRRLTQGLLGDPKEMNSILARMLMSRSRPDQLGALEKLAPYAMPPSGRHPLVRGMTLGVTQQGAGLPGRRRLAAKLRGLR